MRSVKDKVYFNETWRGWPRFWKKYHNSNYIRKLVFREIRAYYLIDTVDTLHPYMPFGDFHAFPFIASTSPIITTLVGVHNDGL